MTPSGRSAAWLRRIGALVAIVLLAASLVLVWSRRDQLSAAAAHLADPSIPHLLLLALGVAGGLLLTGAVFSALMSRYGRVGLMEMQALLAASTLLNYLPLRPGLFGRVAYHHAVNRISPMDAGKSIAQAVALSMGVAAYLALGVMLNMRLHWPLWIIVAAPVSLLAVAAFTSPLRAFALAAMFRFAEVLLYALRSWAAFTLIGSPIGPETALALACVATIANLVPLAGSGLGVREWATGLVAPLLAGVTLETSLTAELVNRAVEMAIVTLAGLGGAAYLARQQSARSSS